MKTFTRTFFVLMAVAFMSLASVQAQTITINPTTTTTCDYVPVSGYYNDWYQQSEFIILSGQIHDDQGNPISKAIHSMTFYLETPSSCSLDGTYQVYLKDVTQNNHSSNTFIGVSTSTVVYQGPLTISNSRMTITFTTDFYHSSSYNLLVGIRTVTPGSNWCNTTFYGVSGENITQYSQAGLHAHGEQAANENYNNNGFCPEVTLEFVDAYTIRAYTSPSAGGTLSINGGSAGTYKYLTVGANTIVTLKRESTNSGYTWKGWAVGSPTASTYSTSQTINYTVTSNVTLYAVYNTTNVTITAVADAGGKVRINSSGSWSSSASSSVSTSGSCVLNAQADDCYAFSHWTNSSGQTVSTSANYTVSNPSVAATYTAHFTLSNYNITANAGTGGKVKINGSYSTTETASVDCGSGCTLYAQADECYTFQSWTNASGQTVSTSATYAISNVEAAATYTANFTLDNYTVSASANPSEGGIVTGAGEYNCGSSCTLTATANEGYTFANWTENGSVVSTNPSYTFTVTGSGNYIANFTQNGYTITVNPSENGSVTASHNVAHGGDTITLTITPETCSALSSITCISDGGETIMITENTFVMPYDNVTIDAEFNISYVTYGTDIQIGCGSFTWIDGHVYTANNNTATYTITGGNQYGCDSIVTLNLTVIKPNSAVDERFACDSLTWIDGNVYTEDNNTAIYVIEGGGQYGCDSTIVLDLTIGHSQIIDIYESACETFSWEDGNGQTYTASGEYENTVVVGGCDSTVVLHLTINHNEVAEPETVVNCGGYEWHDSTYTASGVYTYETPIGSECVMIETLNLTVIEPVINNLDITACDIYIWNNVSYIEEGDYSQTLTAVNGCDSIVNIHLTLLNSTTGEFDMEACDHYIWNNLVYANSGDFNQTFAAANGCDSTVTMHLTIKLPVFHEFDAEECPGYVWNGNTYTLSGDYVQTFVGSNGCDSTVTMHLTVKDSPLSEFEVVACDSYEWDGVEYDSNGNYPHIYEAANGCDSTAVMLLTIHTSPVASITGDLWVATGVQDSTILTAWGGIEYLWSTGDTTQSIVVAPSIETTYYVTVTDENGCSSTAEAVVINSTGIDEASINLNIYPNPTNNVVNVEADDMKNIRVTDVLGQVLIEKNATGDLMRIDMSKYASGQYFMQVYTAKGMITRKIVKK